MRAWKWPNEIRNTCKDGPGSAFCSGHQIAGWTERSVHTDKCTGACWWCCARELLRCAHQWGHSFVQCGGRRMRVCHPGWKKCKGGDSFPTGGARWSLVCRTWIFLNTFTLILLAFFITKILFSNNFMNKTIKLCPVLQIVPDCPVHSAQSTLWGYCLARHDFIKKKCVHKCVYS